jgi:hypothetical protein
MNFFPFLDKITVIITETINSMTNMTANKISDWRPIIVSANFFTLAFYLSLPFNGNFSQG